MCFGSSNEPSHGDGSFEYPQHTFWLRNKKNNVQFRTLEWGPASKQVLYERVKTQIKCRRITAFYRNFEWQRLKIQNGQFHSYCINMYGIIHQNEKGQWVKNVSFWLS